MRFRQDSSSSLALGAFLIVATLMLGQTTSGAGNRRNAGREHSSLSDQQPQSGQPAIVVDHVGGNGVRRMAGGNAGNGASSAAGQPYKDSEDMTTRYRPGNNKTTTNSIAVDQAGGNGVRRMAGGHNGTLDSRIAVDHAGGNGVRRMDGGHADFGGQRAGTATSPNFSTAAKKRKHIAGVKYQDRMSKSGNVNSGSAARVAKH